MHEGGYINYAVSLPVIELIGLVESLGLTNCDIAQSHGSGLSSRGASDAGPRAKFRPEIFENRPHLRLRFHGTGRAITSRMTRKYRRFPRFTKLCGIS